MKRIILVVMIGMSLGLGARAQVIQSDEGVVGLKEFQSVSSPLFKSGLTEHHLLVMTQSETPHVHADYDLLVLLQRGEAVLHVPAGSYPMSQGDVAMIQRGDEHWAELLSDDAMVYIVKIYSDIASAPSQ